MDKYTDGLAFPGVDYKKPDGVGAHIMTISGGMTLRDYFAAKALAALLSNDGGAAHLECAIDAYKYADAMLEARAK